MTPDQIATATADRFARWGRFLSNQQATPLMMIGLRIEDSQPILTMIEELSDEEAVLFLEGVARVLRRGRRQPMARPAGATGTADFYTVETPTS